MSWDRGDPTDCSPDDDSDWLSLVEAFEEWMDRMQGTMAADCIWPAH